MDYTVFKTKILIKSSLEVANASLFEILIKLKPGEEKITEIWQSMVAFCGRDREVL